jgi:hypothetical protein
MPVPRSPSNPSLAGPVDRLTLEPDAALTAGASQTPAPESHDYDCVYCKQSFPQADAERAAVLVGAIFLCPACVAASDAGLLSLLQAFRTSKC